jgi:LysM repeat protein
VFVSQEQLDSHLVEGQLIAKSFQKVTQIRVVEQLRTIGKKHNVSTDQMKQISQLRKGTLKPGDVITLRVGS